MTNGHLIHCPERHGYWATFTEDLDGGHSPSPCPVCHPYDEDCLVTQEMPTVPMSEMMEGAR